MTKSLYSKFNLITFYFNNKITYRKLSCSHDAKEILEAIETKNCYNMLMLLGELYKSAEERLIEDCSLEMKKAIDYSYSQTMFRIATGDNLKNMAKLIGLELDKNLPDCDCRVEVNDYINGMTKVNITAKPKQSINKINCSVIIH